MRLKDKIGIVTAAASGMGRVGVLRFAREGARVAVVDLDATKAQQVGWMKSPQPVVRPSRSPVT